MSGSPGSSCKANIQTVLSLSLGVTRLLRMHFSVHVSAESASAISFFVTKHSEMWPQTGPEAKMVT